MPKNHKTSTDLKPKSSAQTDSWISEEEIKNNGEDQGFSRKKMSKLETGQINEDLRWSLPNLNNKNTKNKKDTKSNTQSLFKVEKEKLQSILTNKHLKDSKLSLPQINQKQRLHFSNKVQIFSDTNDKETVDKNNVEKPWKTFDDENYLNVNGSDDETSRNEFQNWNYFKEKMRNDEHTSVNEFVEEMNEFYEEMAEKLKLLKSCPVLNRKEEISDNELNQNIPDIKSLYQNLKNTPQMQKNLNYIGQMEKNINQTIDKFKAEKTERLEIQKSLINQIPVDKENELFMQLCDFEIKTKTKINTNKECHGNINTPLNKPNNHENFIERNKKLAKNGTMNFSLTDEEKQRVELILQSVDENISTRDQVSLENRVDEVYKKISAELLRSNLHLQSGLQRDDTIYQNCNLNAFRLSDEEKDKLIEIDTALLEYENERLDRKQNSSSDFNIEKDLIKSLKDVDEKLAALKAAYQEDEKKLGKLRKENISDNKTFNEYE